MDGEPGVITFMQAIPLCQPKTHLHLTDKSLSGATRDMTETSDVHIRTLISKHFENEFLRRCV